MDNVLLYLEQEKENKYIFLHQNHFELVQTILPYIGHQDGHIRDDIVYPALAHLLHDKHLTNTQLQDVLETLLSEQYLLYDLENKESWSVLKRSFTTLQLVILIYVHNRDHVFGKEIIRNSYGVFLDYFKRETIFTGYHSEVGWAHSMAHSADFFAELVRCKELEVNDILNIWTVILQRFVQGNHLYDSDEDERFVTVFERRYDIVGDDVFVQWLQTVSSIELPQTFPERYIKKQNKNHLFRALYFRLQDQLSESAKKDLEVICQNVR